LIAVALVDGEPGVSVPEARGDNEIDLHQLAADLDDVQRAALHDGLATLVFPPVGRDDVPGGLLLARLPYASELGRGAVPRLLEGFDLLLGGRREEAGGDALHDPLGPTADFDVVTGRRRLPQGVQGRLADDLQLLAGRLPLRKGIIPQLLNEAGDPVPFR